MTDRELLQQALDMLDDINQCSLPPKGIFLPAEIDHVMEALRTRLAQREPEHDFYTTADKDRPEVICDRNGEVVLNLCKRCGKGEADLIDEPCGQPEPEAVAWGVLDDDGQIDWTCDYPFSDHPGWPNSAPLYTAPPQREWVDLTNDEIDDIWAKFNDGYGIIEETLWGYERAIEAKLKEKNV